MGAQELIYFPPYTSVMRYSMATLEILASITKGFILILKIQYLAFSAKPLIHYVI